jgi:hypothetical protein
MAVFDTVETAAAAVAVIMSAKYYVNGKILRLIKGMYNARTLILEVFDTAETAAAAAVVIMSAKYYVNGNSLQQLLLKERTTETKH